MSDTAPPVLSDDSCFRSWKREVTVWLLATTAAKGKQAPKLVFAMKGRARDICMKLDPTILSADDGVQQVIKELSSVFDEDNTQSTFSAIESFAKFVRPADMHINERLHTTAPRVADTPRKVFGIRDGDSGLLFTDPSQLVCGAEKIDKSHMWRDEIRKYGGSNEENVWRRNSTF